jgi:hypothetical protein
VTTKKPTVRGNIQFGDDVALAKFTGVEAEFRDASIISIGGAGSCALPGPK